MKDIIGKFFASVGCIALGLVLIVLPFAAFLGMAFLTDSLAMVSLIAVLVFTCLGIPGMYWLSGRVGKKRRSVAASVTLAIHLVITSIAVYVLFFHPLPGIDISMPCNPDGYWDLETGSRIAYRHTLAQGDRRQTPVIWLHGGPGMPIVCLDQNGEVLPHPLDQLAELGFDVYYYDQLGCGHSARLDDPRDYTVDRHVQDLEAIRKKLGSDKIIIVGLSWGSMLAAQYAAAYPEATEAIVFESPGWICADSWPSSEELEEIFTQHPQWKTPQENKHQLHRLSLIPRAFFGGLLAFQINHKLAFKLSSDQEWSEFEALMGYLRGDAQVFCDPSKFATQVIFGRGSYAKFSTWQSFRETPDPRPKLVSNMTPALVIRGHHDWIPKRIALEYVDGFPNADFEELSDCGHRLFFEQAHAYYRTVEEFLLRVCKKTNEDIPSNNDTVSQ